MIATGSADATVKLWDLESGSWVPLETLKGFKDSVSCVEITADQIVTSSLDGYLRIYDIRMGQMLVQNFNAPILGLFACFEDDFIFVSTNESKIYLYDKGKREIVTEFSGNHRT